jgi:hypothetical protein
MKLTSLLTALALVLTLGSWGPAQAGAQIPGAGGLAQRVERLGAELTAAQSLLKKTRTTLRRQATRLSRLERRLGGDDGPGALGIASPDGRFALAATNDGLRLRGPGASVVVGATSLTLSGGSGTTLQLTPARTALIAPQLFLGAGSSCPPVARVGDGVQVQGAGELLRGSITGSSTGVFAC